jgi:DNA repair protein RadC
MNAKPTRPRKVKFATTAGNVARVIVVNDSPAASYNAGKVDSPENTVAFWNDHVMTQPDFEFDKESLVVILLSTALRPISWHRVSVGSMNETLAHPSAILRPAVAMSAFAIILMHNHPSGTMAASQSDRDMTAKLKVAAEYLKIRLLDHVIVVENESGEFKLGYSFREYGDL